MDTADDDDVPLILGRPFMKTVRMMIDIDDGLMKVRLEDEKVSLNLFEDMKHSKDKVECFKLDVIDETIMDVRKQVQILTPLEITLREKLNVINVDKEKEIEGCLKEIDSSKEVLPKEENIE